jgi:membrane fusion protein, copper/silver efflux system
LCPHVVGAPPVEANLQPLRCMHSFHFHSPRGRAELTALLLLLAAGLAGFAGWHFGRRPSAPDTSAARKVLYYQSPMHPQVKSDRPGNCTICGMKLVPVYEGETGGAVGGVRLSQQAANVIHVATASVVRQPIQRTIRVAGMIDDDDSAHRRLSAYVEARIEKLHVNYVGAEVEAGQPLAELFSRELIVARGEYTLATKMPAGSDRENAISATRQKLRRLGLTAEQVEKLPGQTGDTFGIIAPISGTVVARNVYEGQYVKEGDVLFEIADFTKMWFVFEAYERDLAWIRVGQSVEIVTPSVPGKVYRAPIAFIDPNLNPETRSARIRVVLDNPHVGDPARHRHELLHKVYAEGRITVETEPVLTIPRSAVLNPDSAPLVYLARGEAGYEPRGVLLGRVGDDVWEVLDGLDEKDRVVTTGNLLIDAQAQLERGSPAPSVVPLDATQQAAARKFIEAIAATGRALAADDLAAHNASIPALQASATEVGAALPHGRLSSATNISAAKDLVSARKQFYPLSMAAADLVPSLRRAAPDLAKIKVFQCPMAKSAVPSAETNEGRWVQLEGPLRNPFFGAEMLECGEEVRP